MNAHSAMNARERHDEPAITELPYAPLPMPRQKLEPEFRLRDVLGRMMRLPLVRAQREQ